MSAFDRDLDYMRTLRGDSARVPVPVASKVCPRCGADIHAPDAPHLCADKVARMKRQERFLRAVEDIIEESGFWLPEDVNEAIVRRLLNMGIDNEP